MVPPASLLGIHDMVVFFKLGGAFCGVRLIRRIVFCGYIRGTNSVTNAYISF